MVDRKPSDNRNEVFRAYLWTMAMTVGFLALQLVVFYLPSLQKNKEALQAILADKKIDLGPLTTADAIRYGSFLQSAAGFEDMSGASFCLWMLISHAAIVLIAVLSERLYAKQFAGKSYYQDLTLEFKGLSEKYDDEEKVYKLFQFLSSDNIREISLLYELNEYYDVKNKISHIQARQSLKGESPESQLKKSMYEDRLDSFKNHFRRFKKGYFLGRGFVTFKSHKMAYEMKEIYKRAFTDKTASFVDKAIRLCTKTSGDQDSKARRRFRKIVITKVFPLNPKYAEKRRDPLTSAVKLLFGGSGSMFNRKARLLRQEAGDKFSLNRGVAAEDINWNYTPEKKLPMSQLALFFFVVLFVLPAVMYFISLIFYENTIDNLRKVQRSVLGLVFDKVLFVSMLGIDQMALFLVEKVIPSQGFLKTHQAAGLRFMATNLYFLSSGLFFLILGLVVAANRKLADMATPKERFEVTKQLLDSFYLTFIALIATNLNSHIFVPVVKFNYLNKGVPVPRDVSYPLSFLCLAVFYVGFFAPFDINIIPVMLGSALVLLVAEVCLLWLGVVTPTRFSFTLLGNYFIALVWGLLPTALSAYLMLEGNKLGINALGLSKGDNIWLGLLLCGYVALVAGFTVLFKNERLLRRVQTRIWDVNSSIDAPSELLGSSYRSANPVYSFEEKVKTD